MERVKRVASRAAPVKLESGGISLLRAGAGTGRPLVMLHGIGSNAQSFIPLMERFAGRRDVLAWDAPGYGTSAPLPEEWPRADDYANALLQLLQRLGLNEIDLLGHSLGALIAGRFAAIFPDRVKKLVLASPALGYATRPGAPLAPPAAGRLEGFLSEGAEEFARSRAPRLVFKRDDVALVASVTEAMSRVKLPGYRQASRMLSCADLLGDAASISSPTLVLVGAQDEITPPGKCRGMYDAFRAARGDLLHRFELVADAGHAVVQERPDEVAALVVEHLSDGEA
jgi:pimeloyl-ACP methyl ester carboxylesterase